MFIAQANAAEKNITILLENEISLESRRKAATLATVSRSKTEEKTRSPFEKGFEARLALSLPNTN